MPRQWGKPVAVAVAFLAGVCISVWLNGMSVGVLGSPAEDGAASGPRGYRHRRVICMSPAVVEIVFAIGAGDRVVGITEHTMYPPEALERPICGGFFNPNLERIVALQPDLIVTQGEAEDLARFAEDNGIEIASLMLSDLESISRETRRVGRLLEMEPEAELLCAEMGYRLARVRARTSRHPSLRIALVTWRDPGALSGITVAGPGGFLHDLVELAGGRNIFSDLPRPYANVSKEALLQRAPQVIVELHGEGEDHLRLEEDVRKLWGGLPSLPAVRSGRVHAIESTYAMIPGPRVVHLAERLADLLHGEGSQ